MDAIDIMHMWKVYFQLTETDARCVSALADVLRKLSGVSVAEAHFNAMKIGEYLADNPGIIKNE